MSVRPFMLVSASALAAVEAALAPAVRDWACAWGVSPAALTVRAERACESVRQPGPSTWTLCAGTAARACWLQQPPELQAELQGLLFPRDTTHAPQGAGAAQLAPLGARRALLALQAALAGAAVPGIADGADAAATPDDQAWRRGAGAVQVSIGMGRQRCLLLLNHGAVGALAGALPASAPLAPLAPLDRRQAASATPVALQLNLGGARVSLASLLALAVGDVIRLDSKVDEPVRMASAAGVSLFEAYLGKQGDQVAVETVIRHSPRLEQ